MLVAPITWETVELCNKIPMHILSVNGFTTTIYIFEYQDEGKCTLEANKVVRRFDGNECLKRAKDVAHSMVNAFRTELM